MMESAVITQFTNLAPRISVQPQKVLDSQPKKSVENNQQKNAPVGTKPEPQAAQPHKKITNVIPETQPTPQQMTQEEIHDQASNFNVGLCETHGAPLEVVDITERKLVCSKCALFGNIRNHTFRELTEVINQIFERADQ
jgi:hypothetical protein